ncbi:ADP-ribose glycohydrolase ARH3 isoform X1 [Crotalus tigris]|uniref:ADP-ribose glycohydrolase ARH3 isoform X1 n=1 Tax=Crotalus tigris TaxID=88082 RepID=UPI00192F992D|nr:ADP-ribose glycohydrolase ARH3 isoform X1 [Crotalus tigris]
MAAKVSLLRRSRCRGCLLGALLGDCLGGGFEARESVSAAELLRFVRALPSPPRGGSAAEPGEESSGGGGKSEGGRVSSEQSGTAWGSSGWLPRGLGEILPLPHKGDSKILCYSDDTALAHSLVRSLLATKDFDEVDMAKRFAEEYDKDPDRSYGGGVVTVFKKLLSPKCRDVFEPARQQFNGKGSYGNGGAMRVAGISLAYSDVQDVKKFAKLSAELTHANSLGYNGAILQALAVHFALRGESDRYKFLDQLIGQMEDVEADDKSVADARMLGYEDRPFSKRLKKIKEFLEQGSVSRSDVLLELGNGIAALHSVPTAIYSFLRCMESHPDVPDSYNCLQRTIMYCILLGGDTDTIATMAGAMAGAFYGEEQVPPSWKESCEAYEEAEKLADALCERYHQSA